MLMNITKKPTNIPQEDIHQPSRIKQNIVVEDCMHHRIVYSASKSSIRRFVIAEKAPTRAFSWLKAARPL